MDDVNESLVYYIALKEAGVPVEMHLTHMAATRSVCGPRTPVSQWPQLVRLGWTRLA